MPFLKAEFVFAALVAVSTWMMSATESRAALPPAEPLRIWTKASDSKAILARPLAKKSDNSAIKVRTDKGKVFWLKADILIEEDKKFIKQWVLPVDHLEIRLIGSGRGYKKLEIKAAAGSKHIRIRITPMYRPRYPIRRTHHVHLTPGQNKVLEFKVEPEYVVQAIEGEKDDDGKLIYAKVVDEETHKRKTGL